MRNGVKNTELFEIILARSPLFPKPHSPLQTYPVPRGYKGSAIGWLKVTKNKGEFGTGNRFLNAVGRDIPILQKPQRLDFNAIYAI